MAFEDSQNSYIEALFFLSDSTILILLSGQEIRILDTQAFYPEKYEAEILHQRLKKINRKVIFGIDGSLQYPEELERGIRCAKVLKPQ